MNYELAKRLKDAGFPYKEGSWWKSEAGPKPEASETESWLFTPPTLSELIEACGKDFDFLANDRNGKWRASGGKEKIDDGLGSTPEQAVASLWLALHSETGV